MLLRTGRFEFAIGQPDGRNLMGSKKRAATNDRSCGDGQGDAVVAPPSFSQAAAGSGLYLSWPVVHSSTGMSSRGPRQTGW